MGQKRKSITLLNPLDHSEKGLKGNAWVRIGGETYFLGSGGQLMPMLKGQAPPDLRYFK